MVRQDSLYPVSQQTRPLQGQDKEGGHEGHISWLHRFESWLRAWRNYLFFFFFLGGCKKKNGKAYVKKVFLQKVHQKEQSEIFPHFTVAVDTNNVSKIFKGVRTTILKGILGGK